MLIIRPPKHSVKRKGLSLHQFKGPHPAGNVGIQIHHIAPVNKGEMVWYIRPQDVIAIGRLFMDGKVDNTPDHCCLQVQKLRSLFIIK